MRPPARLIQGDRRTRSRDEVEDHVTRANLLGALAVAVCSAAAKSDVVVAEGAGSASSTELARVVIRCRPGLRADEVVRTLRDQEAEAGSTFAETLKGVSRCGAINFRLAFDPPPANVSLASKVGLDRFLLADVAPGADALKVCRDLADRSNGVFELVEREAIGELHSVPPNDPLFVNQWSMLNTGQTVEQQMGVPGVDLGWLIAIPPGLPMADVVVAVLDTGLSRTHPEFEGRTVPGRNVTTGNGGDPSNTADWPNNSHGTKCSGVIAAAQGNSIGISGVAANAKVMPIKIQVGSSVGAALAAQGLTWATDHGARIASMSWGIPSTASGLNLLRTAVLYAHDSGVLLLSSTGNVPGAAINFPAAWPEVIAVGATDNRDQLALFSTTGPEMDVVAPGASIETTVDQLNNPNGYAYENGTSFAAPMAAAVAAMVWGVNPSLTAEDVRTILIYSSRDLGPAGYDATYAWGRLDAAGAVREAIATLPRCPADLSGNRVVDTGDLFYFFDLYFLYAGQTQNIQFLDFDHDSMIGVGDIFLYLDSWFRGC